MLRQSYIQMMRHKPDVTYLNLINDIFDYGEKRKGRNGITHSIFGYQMRFSLKDNKIPLLTTKKIAWKTCLKELLWFINGGILNKELQEQNVHIWDGNSSKEFLESRNLRHYNNDLGELGPIYGFQWRNFNGNYHHYFHNKLSEHCGYYGLTKYSNDGIDQLQNVINILKGKDKNETKYSRRLIVTAWNPCQINDMALPPCHVLFQFYVNSDDELSCSLYQRSGDVGLGIPFNIASYSFLTHLIAKHCDLKPGYFIHNIGDCHIYEDHVDALKSQLDNKIYDTPTLNIKTKRENINDYIVDDFEIKDYKYDKVVKMKMSA